MKNGWRRAAAEISGAALLGIVLGALAKYLDTVPSNGSLINEVLHWFADLFTRLGIWVFLAVLLAAFCRTPRRAAARVFAFFAGMLIAYYVYSMHMFGFFPMRYFLFWGVLALTSPACAVIVWLGRHHEKLAWVLPALPVGLMLELAVSAGWGYVSVHHPAELVRAAALCAVFYRSPKQLACVLALSIAAVPVIGAVMPFAF